MPDLQERLKAALSDRYSIEREIGRGGMARVFLAEDLKHHRKVAIKVLHPELSASLGAERFQREIEIAAGLDHPHILKLLDSGQADGLLYYVMPYVEGESLRERLEREHQLPIEEAVRIAREVADGLSHAHRHGVVHRDIKPANIMLSESHALIADFGVARAVAGEGQALTSTGRAVGTPAYMRPEQASGGEVDARSDLYALGCVLYEMLAGEPPLLGRTPRATAALRLTQTPAPLRVLRDTVPEGLDRITQKLLATTPADRHGTAEKLIEELEGPEHIHAPSKERSSRSWGVNRAVWIGLTIGLVLATVWGAQALLRPSLHEADPFRIAVLPLTNRTGDSKFDPLGQQIAERIGDVIRREEVGLQVPAAEVAEAVRVEGASTSGLARATGAGRVISGSYATEGDSLSFRLVLTDAVAGVQLGTAVASSPVHQPQEAIPRLEEQAAVLFLMLADEEDPGAWGELPTLHAYRMTRKVRQHFRNSEHDEMFASALVAAELDPRFLLPKLFAYVSSPDSVRADSVWQSIDPRRHEIPLGYRRWFEALELYWGLGARGTYANDVYRATGRTIEAGTYFGNYVWHAWECMAVNRPGEAAAALEDAMRLAEANPTSVRWASCTSCFRAARRLSTSAFHVLGDHERELEAARSLLALEPDQLHHRYYELLALVGLGRLGEVGARIQNVAGLTADVMSPGEVLLGVAMDLRQHGYEDEAAEVFDRAIGWYETLSAEGRLDSRNVARFGHTLYYAGRWERARDILEPLYGELEVHPDSAIRDLSGAKLWVEYVGTLGLLSARLGDATGIERHLATLHRMDASTALLRGRAKLQLARIASLCGQRDKALALLRQAVDEGHGYYGFIFVHPSSIADDFAGMADYPPYQEFMRPRG
jgi:serine/threonine protein kinase/tetratricopeptide (TPR) repeat protein